MSNRIRKPKEPVYPEKAVKSVVKGALADRGAYYHMPLPPGNLNTTDFFSCVPIVITPDMVGKRVGVFVAIETKRTNVKTVLASQANCIRRVRAAGGVALMVNQVDSDAVREQITWALKTGFVLGQLGMGG